MLERVPATAESAAHLFLRSFERPYRSTRVLDPNFWRHGLDHLDTPAWWPLYLQQVRQVPHSRPAPAEVPTVQRWNSKPVTPRPRRTPGARPFTASASPAQQGQAQQRVYDVFGQDDDYEERAGQPADVEDAPAENAWALRRKERQRQQQQEDFDQPFVSDLSRQRPANARVSPQTTNRRTTFDHAAPSAPVPPPNNNQPHESHPQVSQSKEERRRNKFEQRFEERLEQILDLSDHNHKAFNGLVLKKNDISAADFDRAWRLFIALDIQEKVASYMFKFLSRSAHSSDVPRALEAFRLIPRDERRYDHYHAAICLEQKRYQHHGAMNLAFEAAIKGFKTPLQDLLAYFVQNLLWNSVAELLHRNKTADRDMAAFALELRAKVRRKVPLDHELLKSCANVKDLHLKVLSLAERLRSRHADLLEHKDLLDTFFKDLVVFCVRSPECMRSAAASGLLALFDLQNEFGCLQLQEEALHTLLHSPSRAAKVDIALMTYRNLRFNRPHAEVPTWMLGGLIGICSDANYSLDIYNYLLDEFEDIHGVPDEQAYQRILTSCARQGNTDAVYRVFAQYRHHHDKISNIAWLTPLIYCHAVTGDVDNARKQFARIKDEFGYEPNQTCWNMLLLAHVRSDDQISAFDVFEEMQKSHIRPGSYTYGTLLAICAAYGDTETALELLAKARDDGVRIMVPMVNTVVEAYLSNHDVQAAMRFAISTSQSGTSESLTRLWNSFIRYFAAKGDIPGLMKARRLMSDYNVKADEMTYAAVMSALTLMRKTSEAVTLLQDMHHKQGLAVTAFHYSIVLHGFVMEHNRDMVVVIANEMRQRFPNLSPGANRALLLLQSQRDRYTKGQNTHSVTLFASVLEDMYTSGGTASHFDQSFGRPQKGSVVASLYFETVIESMIQSGSYEQASQLLDHLETTMRERETVDSARSTKLLLARMDVAIARGDHRALQHIWDRFFDYASRNLKSIRSLRQQRETSTFNAENTDADKSVSGAVSPGDSRSEETPVLRAWRISLSKPLNRYIEAMAQQNRLDEMVGFVKRRFRTAGFKLTGQNWNKYIQVLCRSRDVNHHAHAFAMTETLMLNRAQSWKLLQRGLLRQKRTSYMFKAIGEHKRPLLQGESSYSVAKRLDVMRFNPRRIIPTYTTMVHLSSVLAHAAREAENGYPLELNLINQFAPDTKKFLQKMPYLKDSLQGQLLRGLERGNDPKPRPRSEQSTREKVDVSGIFGSKSPLDHLPAEFLEDIEAIVRPRDDIRALLKGTTSSAKFSRSDEQDIQLGEKFFGKIARDPIVLAGKGRFETDLERAIRVKQHEKEKIKQVRALREDLRRRQLTGEVYRRDLDSGIGGLRREGPFQSESLVSPPSTTLSLLPLPVLRRDNSSDPQRETSLQETLQELPVREQINILTKLGQANTTGGASSDKRSTTKRAIPYAERRRIGKFRALKQRQATRRLLDHLGRENVSDRALQPRTVAGRRALLTEQAQRRRREYLRYEADVKAGKRTQPLPKTRHGYWKRLLDKGPSGVRFVADLNRHPNRYLIRRGRLVERRRPAVSPGDLEERKFKITTKRRRRDRNRRRINAIRRAMRGLPPAKPEEAVPVVVGARHKREPTVEGELYLPRV